MVRCRITRCAAICFLLTLCSPLSSAAASSNVSPPERIGPLSHVATLGHRSDYPHWRDLAFSNNNLLLAGCGSLNARIWNTADWEVESSAIAHTTGLARAIQFSPDSRYLVVGLHSTAPEADVYENYWSGQLRVWDLQTWQVAARFGEGAVWAVDFSPDQTWLATAAADGSTQGRSGVVRVYSTESWTELSRLPIRASDPRYLEFSPDGQILAAITNQLHVWQTDKWDKVADASADVEPGLTLAFSLDSRRLAVSGSSFFSNYVEIVEVSSWESMARLSGHQDEITSMSFMGSDQYLAVLSGALKSGETRAELVLWDVESRKKVGSWRTDAGYGSTLAVSSDEGLVAFAVGGWILVYRFEGARP